MTFERHYQEHGVAVIEWALQPSDLSMLSRAFRPRKRSGRQSAFGVHAFQSVAGRNSSSEHLPADLVDWIETHPVLIEVASRLVGAPAKLVSIARSGHKAVLNWFVPWHQDRMISVASRVLHPEFSGWSRKGTIWQVEPPTAVLEQMVTLSVHLDPCGDADGPLEVLPGTHSWGRMRRSDIGNAAAIRSPQVCLADRGDILAISPLTVHRVRRARSPSRCRIIHLKYASCELPAPLAWASLMPDMDMSG